MNKAKLSIFLILGVLICFPINIDAQQEPEQTQVTTPPPIGEEQDPNRPSAGNEDTNNITEEKSNEIFTNGLTAGLLVGSIISGILTWFLKDKLFR